MTQTNSTPYALRACEGRIYQMGDHTALCKAGAEDTGGAFSLFDVTAMPGGGTPPHIHHREEETFFILEGRFAIQVEDRTIEVGPGDCVFGPRGHVHAWRSVGKSRGRMLVLITPGGFEDFMAEVEELHIPEEPTAEDLERVAALLHRYRIEMPIPGK